jgi:hypothetical protein
VFALVSAQVGFFEDVVKHSLLIHVVVVLFVSIEVDTYELFARSVGDVVLVRVEGSDEEVPLVHVVGTAKPSEVVAMSNEKDRAIVDPLVKELEVPRCVLVAALCDTAVKLFGEVLTGCRCIVDITYCLDDLVILNFVPLRGLDEPLKILTRACH